MAAACIFTTVTIIAHLDNYFQPWNRSFWVLLRGLQPWGGFRRSNSQNGYQKGWRVGFSLMNPGSWICTHCSRRSEIMSPMTGLISMTGTFIDTIIICSLTGLCSWFSDEWMARAARVPDSGYVYRRLLAQSEVLFWRYAWCSLRPRPFLDGLITEERCFNSFWHQAYQPLSDLLCLYGWTGSFLKLDLVWVIADVWMGWWLCQPWFAF